MYHKLLFAAEFIFRKNPKSNEKNPIGLVLKEPGRSNLREGLHNYVIPAALYQVTFVKNVCFCFDLFIWLIKQAEFVVSY